MKKVLLGILITLVVIVLIGVLVAGYLGLVPGLADIFGANKPRDLGVKYTQADYDSYLAKTNTQVFEFAQAPVAPAHPADTIVFTDPQAKNVVLTSAEISARAAYTKWADNPVTDVQVKCEANGAVEISGRLVTSRLAGFAAAIGYGGYSAADVKTATDWLGVAGTNPAVYIKAQGSITNNVPSITVSEAQINRLGVPADLTDQIAVTLAKSILSRVPGLNVKSATFGADGLHFDGTSPTKYYVKQ
jgi:hypothetical protein